MTTNIDTVNTSQVPAIISVGQPVKKRSILVAKMGYPDTGVIPSKEERDETQARIQKAIDDAGLADEVVLLVTSYGISFDYLTLAD